MNKNLLNYLETRLHQWAEWYSKKDLQALGYPSTSHEYHFLRVGVVTKNHEPQPLPYNEEAEEIEAFVREMAEQTPNIASALRYHYFTTGSLRVKAKKLHMSHTQFKHFIDMAHYWLAGRLNKNSFVRTP